MSYCHCTLYLASHHPTTYKWNSVVLGILAILYLFVYWVWDTCNSQKNFFRAQERGVSVHRKAFPQLPWKFVKDPRTIRTKTGDSILCDGWCKFSNYLSNCALTNNRRWNGPQGSLYLRLVLRYLLGTRHWISITVPLVLSGILLDHDHPSDQKGYQEMSREVRGSLGGI